MSPSIPAPPNLNDPKFAGAVDLDQVREDAAKEKAAREARANAAAEEYVRVWLKAMKRAFRGVRGGDGLTRRFNMRAQVKRMERGAPAEGNFKGSQ